MAELTITKENFETEVLHSDQPVLLDFGAPWCGPCRMLEPIITEIAEEYEGKVKVGKVNIDRQPEIAAAFRVLSVPTLALVKNGIVVNYAVGYCTKERIAAMLEE